MGITPFQYQQMLERTSGGKVRQPVPEDATLKELPLHDEIIAFCYQQHPRWKYIHANPTAKSTIAKGCQDFTLFLPGGVTLCIECKSKTGKLKPDQLAWKLQMEMLGHTVHVIQSMSDFLKLVSETTQVKPNEKHQPNPMEKGKPMDG